MQHGGVLSCRSRVGLSCTWDFLVQSWPHKGCNGFFFLTDVLIKSHFKATRLTGVILPRTNTICNVVLILMKCLSCYIYINLENYGSNSQKPYPSYLKGKNNIIYTTTPGVWSILLICLLFHLRWTKLINQIWKQQSAFGLKNKK